MNDELQDEQRSARVEKQYKTDKALRESVRRSTMALEKRIQDKTNAYLDDYAAVLNAVIERTANQISQSVVNLRQEMKSQTETLLKAHDREIMASLDDTINNTRRKIYAQVDDNGNKWVERINSMSKKRIRSRAMPSEHTS